MLRPSELKSLRTAFATGFVSRCDLLANVGKVNDLGNPVSDWQPTNSKPIPCRLVPQTGTSESSVADQTTSTAESALLLPYGTVVDAAQRIRVVDGVTYEVVYVQPNNAEDVSLCVDVKRVG